jgi:hypothetical protein
MLESYGHRMAKRHCGELFAMTDEKWTAGDHESAHPNSPSFAKTPSKSVSLLACGTLSCSPETVSGRHHLADCGLCSAEIGRIDEKRHDPNLGKKLVQQFQPFRRDLYARLCHTRNVSARSAKAGHETQLDRVAARFKDDRNGHGCCLCCDRRRSAGRRNHGYLAAHQIGHHHRQAVVSIIRPAVFDQNILAIDVASFGKTFVKSCQLSAVILGETSVDEPDHRHRRVLRARRSTGGKSANECEKFPSPHAHSLGSGADIVTAQMST